jgi:hypothetical protein
MDTETCPKCKETNPGHAQYCGECGTSLEGLPPAPAGTGPIRTRDRRDRVRRRLYLGLAIAMVVFVFLCLNGFPSRSDKGGPIIFIVVMLDLLVALVLLVLGLVELLRFFGFFEATYDGMLIVVENRPFRETLMVDGVIVDQHEGVAYSVTLRGSMTSPSGKEHDVVARFTQGPKNLFLLAIELEVDGGDVPLWEAPRGKYDHLDIERREVVIKDRRTRLLAIGALVGMLGVLGVLIVLLKSAVPQAFWQAICTGTCVAAIVLAVYAAVVIVWRTVFGKKEPRR